jgi:diguanylate cyclase (GGDEF)-like protein/PAS domain S-box-containing protein
MSAAVINYPRDLSHEKNRPMKFLEQLKLQSFRRFQEESRLYDVVLDDHVSALEALVAQSKDGMAIITGATLLGRESKIQYLNAAFTKITGYTAEDLVGKSTAVLQDISGTLGRVEPIERAPAGTITSIVEIKSSIKGGPKTWVEVSVTPVEDDENHISKWIYMLRDTTGQRLAGRLDGQLKEVEAENSRLVVELEKQKAIEFDLSHNAFHDSLTGLRNRQYFLDQLAKALERTQKRPSYQAAMIYLDLDGFKAVNDSVGHRGGDRVLIETSRRLEKCCRTQDIIARLGGDEFAILIDDVTAEAGASIVRRILDGLADPFDVGNEHVSLTSSLGYNAVRSSYTDVQDIVRDADSAMYLAKRKGGARCVYSDPSLDANMNNAGLQEQELKRAIDSAELQVHYQPILDILTTPPKLWGVEAVVRWQHPDRGLLLPAEFLPVAERGGLAAPLGISVFRAACLQMKRWQSCVMNPDFFLSVNVSRSQVNHPGFFKDIVDILADTEIDARCIQLEVSEEVLAQNGKTAIEAIGKIRDLGVKIALDQFGSGYSSMTQLEGYPIDSVKLDGSLTKRLGGSSKDSKMPKLVIEFAHGLGIQLIAGQVENEEEIKSLRQVGCTLVQGYAFSPAVEEVKITRLLDQGTRSLGIGKI